MRNAIKHRLFQENVHFMSELSNLPQLEQLAALFIKEQRRKRRWGIFFKSIYLLLIIGLLFLFLPDRSENTYKKGKLHVAVIDVQGPIFAMAPASAKNINEALDDAFENKNTIGVILNINSPGGSPVQASDIYNHIHYLRKEHPKIGIDAVCADVCASGSYFVAAAADKIYANPASLIGSIGVIMEGFGFVDTLQKIGASRRVVISGDNKDFMDPFQPVKPADQAMAQQLVDTVHTQFIMAVKNGRGNRLKSDPNLFSGAVWTGAGALPIGLIDGFGNVDSVAKKEFKTKDLVNYTISPSFFDAFTTMMSKNLATEFGKTLGVDGQGLQLR